MSINYFNKVIEEIHGLADVDAQKYDSKVVFGTVLSVDPLEIELQNDLRILPSRHFYLSPNVIVKKVRMIVHRMYGNPREVKFEGSANEVNNSMQLFLYEATKKAESINFQISSSDIVYGLDSSNGDTFISAIEPEITLAADNMDISNLFEMVKTTSNAEGDISFRIEITEEEVNKPILDKPEQPQTTVIEGILWQGLKAGDIVMMSSHNHAQKFIVHMIMNRHRESGYDREKQYEHGIMWDSRINDVGVNEKEYG